MSETMTAHDRPALAGSVSQILDDMIAAGVTGITVRVHDEHGDWAVAAGAAEIGRTGLPPVDGHVRIGSNTKTFTAALVLLLAAEGRLGLDDAASGILPDFGIDPRITVRMLLQHTSGVFNFTGEYYPDGTFVPGIPATTAGKEWADHRLDTYRAEDLVRLALSKPARFEPGEDWSYSNTNYVIARLIVERVTGKPIAEEMERLVLSPLALTGTTQPTTETAIAEPHAHAYYRFDDDGTERTIDVTEHNPSWISSGGDMISTTADLQKLLSTLVTGGLVPSELLDEMLTTVPTPIPGMGYGLGVFVQDLGEHGTVITHNGGIAGHAALMYSTPDGRRTLTASVNYVDDAAMSMAAPFQQGSQRLIDAVFRRPAE